MDHLPARFLNNSAVQRYYQAASQATTIGQRIKLYRHLQQLPQYVLAGRAGLAPSVLSKIEKGQAPTAPQLARLKQVLADPANRSQKYKDVPFLEG